MTKLYHHTVKDLGYVSGTLKQHQEVQFDEAGIFTMKKEVLRILNTITRRKGESDILFKKISNFRELQFIRSLM